MKMKMNKLQKVIQSIMETYNEHTDPTAFDVMRDPVKVFNYAYHDMGLLLKPEEVEQVSLAGMIWLNEFTSEDWLLLQSMYYEDANLH